MEVSVPSGSVCCFCNTTYEDEALYGKFYKIEEITTHYFCLLLSSKVQQRGSDNEGIWGFLPQDIRMEVKRGKKLSCAFCGKRGATLSCHHSKCKIHFHLPCGRLKDTFHEFFGEFKSFCCRHRKVQRIKGDVLKAMSGKQSTCSICLESVPATPSPSTLWAPCCSKDAWFHRICIQRLALSAGYFFKCPLCNNTTQFIESMRTYGIWIPEQDAAWERDPERYEGLLQRHNSCDAKSCRCRNGRTHHVADTKWEIKLCADCGSQGMHVQCGNLRLSQDWICSVCSNVSATTDVRKSGKISHSREAHLARNRERRNLPPRPSQRVTRHRRPPEEDEGGEEKEEEGDKVSLSVHSNSEISASKTDKGASCTPQKDTSSQVIAQPTEERQAGRQPPPDEENSDVEILENSDDEIQILSTPNIRVIKTNSGVSVPVMKVHATQPSGEEVVAAGEPCQPTSCPDQCVSIDTEDDFHLLNVPSTSRIQTQSLPNGGKIILSDEPLQSSQLEDDDDIIVEYEQTNVCQTLTSPSRNISSNVICTPAEASLQTNMPTKDSFQPKSDSAKKQNFNVGVPYESISSNRPEVLSDHNGPATASVASETNVGGVTVCPVTHKQPSLTNVPRSEQIVKTTDLSNMFYDLSKAVHSASVEQQQQQAAVSSLQPEMFMPTANVFQSVSPLTPKKTTSSSSIDSASSGLSVSMQVNPDTDMSAWRSKILNLVRGFPIDTRFTTSSTASNVNGVPDELPTQVPLVSEGVSMQSSDNLPPNSFSSLTSNYLKPHGTESSRRQMRPFSEVTDYSNQLQISKGEAESSRMTSRQVLITLPNQSSQDDWSVEFGQVDAKLIKAQQAISEEHPDVVFERHPGSVPRGSIPWENHEESSSGSDEIIVVDDDDDNFHVYDHEEELKREKEKESKSKRKQKLVERRDYSQVSLFPPALMHFHPLNRLQEGSDRLGRKNSTGACPLVCSGSLLHSHG